MAGKMPPPSVGRCLDGAILRALERRWPGIIEEIAMDLEGETSLSLVARLRSPRVAFEVVDAFADSAVWVRNAEAIAYAYLGRPEKRKRRR